MTARILTHCTWMIVAAQLQPLTCHATRIAVLSDIHIKTNAGAPAGLERAVQETLRLSPDLVVLAGDMTSGNPDDGFSLEVVKSWWSALQRALQPLEQAQIPILPIPGNHDWYTEAHRQAYRAAWPLPAPGVSIDGAFPVQYIVRTLDSELFLLPIVDQFASPETIDFLRKHPRNPDSPRSRIAFGHVPLASRMGRTNPSFQSGFGSALLSAGFSIYISGHEHLAWEENLPTSMQPSSLLRQFWVGTASGSYTFPIRQDLYDRHCSRPIEGQLTTPCRMPENQRIFRVRTSDRSEVLRQSIGLILTGKDRKAPRKEGTEPEIVLRGWEPEQQQWTDFYEN